MGVSLEEVERAHGRIMSSIVRTPFELSRTLSAQTGAKLYLKHENQQFTASFKEADSRYKRPFSFALYAT
jgi:threonine dehydratase